MPILIPKHSMLRPHGTVHVTNCDGPEFVRDTVMCVHCGRHGIYLPGCGRKLNTCTRCNGPICGAEKCRECIGPLEARLDLYEAGKIDVI